MLLKNKKCKFQGYLVVKQDLGFLFPADLVTSLSSIFTSRSSFHFLWYRKFYCLWYKWCYFLFGFLFEQWDKSEDRLALIGLGFAAIVAFWASVNVITVIARTLAF